MYLKAAIVAMLEDCLSLGLRLCVVFCCVEEPYLETFSSKGLTCASPCRGVPAAVLAHSGWPRPRLQCSRPRARKVQAWQRVNPSSCQHMESY